MDRQHARKRTPGPATADAPLPYPAKLALLAVIGGVSGTLVDQIHVQFHVLWYPHPLRWMLGQAFWVPLLFAVVGPLMVEGYRMTAASLGGDRGLGFEDPQVARPRVVGRALWFVAAYLATGLFFRHSMLLTAGLVGAWALRMLVMRPRSLPTVVHSLVLAVTGPLVEAAFAKAGLFTYAKPDLVVPCWLPALYLHLGPLVRHIHLAFMRQRVAPAHRPLRAVA